MAENPRDWLYRRAQCMKLSDPQAVPACREFFEASPPPTPPKPTVQFCQEANFQNRPACDCSANGIDVECIFKICGYEKGYYQSPSLPRFAARVTEELKIWGPKALIAVEFLGFADGTAWVNEKLPKPQPLTKYLEECLREASLKNIKPISTLRGFDLLDARLALLRGCALEEEIGKNIRYFAFDSAPGFSFDSRKTGVSDSNDRAAKLSVVVANACRRLAP